MIDVREIAPSDPFVADLLEKHLILMRASSPACSVHAMDSTALAEAGARFFVAVEDAAPVAMGALKKIDAAHGELKSMHVREDRRGSGLAKALLAHLLEIARRDGCERVSLETGSQEAFAPARAFYGRHGFNTCPPFAGYVPDTNSVFMTMRL